MKTFNENINTDNTEKNFSLFKPRPLHHIITNLNSEGIDLISQMLQLDPKRRITTKEALKHV